MNAQRHRIREGTAGFTLIELLTSIAIVGLLAGIAIQGLSIYRRNAFKATIQTSMRQLRTALEGGATNRTGAEGFLWTFSNERGPVTEINGQQLLPGFVNSDNQSQLNSVPSLKRMNVD